MKLRTRRRNRKRFNKTQRKNLNCSPVVKKARINTESCFTPEILAEIKRAYNKKHPSDIITESDPTRLWWLLKERLDCPKEDCLLEQLGDSTMKSRIQKFIFAPKQPPEWKSNPDEWLSNFDIEDVLNQYEDSNPEFKLMGPTTVDFDTQVPEQGGKCVLEDLCKFDLAHFIREKKTKIGIVINLDKRHGSGSHWVSMFVDIENKFIFFFDSADHPIPREVWMKKPKKGKQPLVNRIIEQGKKEGIEFVFYNNKGHEHQKTDSECGMYTLFFIITMLTGETPFTEGKLSVEERRKLFLQKKIPDKIVFEYRKLYFNS